MKVAALNTTLVFLLLIFPRVYASDDESDDVNAKQRENIFCGIFPILCSSEPSSAPSTIPSSQPTNSPSHSPTEAPSSPPTSKPSPAPSDLPSLEVSTTPSNNPSAGPTILPTEPPSILPSVSPTSSPSSLPTQNPSNAPSIHPSTGPSTIPTMTPSSMPSSNPSVGPTLLPTRLPSVSPSSPPTTHPSSMPTTDPSLSPSVYPTVEPSSSPSQTPSMSPTQSPTSEPTNLPSLLPSTQPSSLPSSQPSSSPSQDPTSEPTILPTLLPSTQPSTLPTLEPSVSPSQDPTIEPTDLPSLSPSMKPSSLPSLQPTSSPSQDPSLEPSTIPTLPPSTEPSALPTLQPSTSPSQDPTLEPTTSPSQLPTLEPTMSPSLPPSTQPSTLPTLQPSLSPSQDPTSEPTALPSPLPSAQPSTSQIPTQPPTIFASEPPSSEPSESPTQNPTSSSSPSSEPSNHPTDIPSVSPTISPTTHPSIEPSSVPSSNPTTSSAPSEEPTFGPRPNLVVIMTDQHNLRTLGCYRDYYTAKNQTEQGYVWGADNIVETPYLDQLAAEGALFTNFHTTTPLCTPNRASFVSGMYPAFTGADRNHNAMTEDIVTFAQVLKEQRDYDTAYFGKWHLNGQRRPGWGDESDFYDFGFNEIKYLFNQGHWKWIEELNNGMMKEYDYAGGEDKFKKKADKHFTTDYLFDRGIEHMERNRLEGKPFLSFLSIPDPHAPKFVRPPYDTMYNDLEFELPYTARTAAFKNPSTPLYNYHDYDNVPLDDVEEYLEEYESWDFFQRSMRQYFGMVKCIDDNVGKLITYLEEAGISDNTIIVFTSDHGDMLAEHGKFNKNRPYRTSAGIPFILRYPEKVMAGKVIETAYTSVDFAPSILNVMGVTDPKVNFQGVDFSDELLNDEEVSSKDVIRFVFDSGNNMSWAAAIMNQYRLVVSGIDVPWLFDLDQDPYEIWNFFNRRSVPDSIQEQLQDALYNAMPEYEIPLYLASDRLVYWDRPACIDSNNRLPTKAVNGVCSDLGVTIPLVDRCTKEKFIKHCPVTCGTCCADSGGELLRLGELETCNDLGTWKRCRNRKIAGFCPSSCNQCDAT